jgi:hypothetical protein
MGTLPKKIIAGVALIFAASQEPALCQLPENGPAPKFSAPLFRQNQNYTFSGDLGRPLVLFFWNDKDDVDEDLKRLNSLAAIHIGDVEVLSVYWGKNTAELDDINQMYGLGLKTILRTADLETAYRITQTPALVAIDKNNRIVLSQANTHFIEVIERRVKDLFLGTLMIEHTPEIEGAEVYLNGDYHSKVGLWGVTISGLKAAVPHKIQLKKREGDLCHESTEFVEAGKTGFVEVKLLPCPKGPVAAPVGSLIVRCSLDSAKVYLDNILRGTIEKGSWKIENLAIGVHTLIVINEKPYSIFRQNVVISLGQTVTVPVPWRAPDKKEDKKIAEKPRPPKTPKPKTPKPPKPPSAIGSYFGVFARYPLPVGILKEAADKSDIGFGTTLRMMSRRAWAWDLNAEYLRLKGQFGPFELQYDIIPLTLNTTVGAHAFHLSAGAGYYFLRGKAEGIIDGRSFVSTFNTDTWGLNGGVGIGLWRFEIGARYHYLPKNDSKKVVETQFFDIYAGITPFYSQRRSSSSRREAGELALSYAAFPASAQINSRYFIAKRERSTPVDEARLYRFSIGSMSKHILGWDFGGGIIHFGKRNPSYLDANFIVRISFVRDRLAASGGAGGGVMLWNFRQRYAETLSFFPTSIVSEGDAVMKNPVFKQAFIGLRFAPLKPVCFFGDVGVISFGSTNKWVDADQDVDRDISSDWLEYRNFKIGGKWLRAGLMIRLLHDND